VMEVAYKIENAIFLVVGVFFSFAFIACIYARTFEWNQSKAAKRFVRFSQHASLGVSILLIVWQIDPYGIQGVYNAGMIVFLKDLMSLVLLSEAIMLAQVLHMVILDHKDSRFKDPFFGVGAPALVLLLIEIPTSCISYLKDLEIYRSIFFAAATLVLFIAAVSCLRLFLITEKTERAIAGQHSITSQRSHDRNQEVTRRLVRSFILILTLTALELFMTIDVIKTNQSLKASQIADADNYHFEMVPLMYCLGLIVCLFHCWLPFRKPRLIEAFASAEKPVAQQPVNPTQFTALQTMGTDDLAEVMAIVPTFASMPSFNKTKTPPLNA
jgi:hypothetical protein